MLYVDQSILVVIDVQGNLAKYVWQSERVLRTISLLIQSAQILNVPIVVSEQVPEKLGPTVDSIKKHFSNFLPIRKSTFSCCGESAFNQKLEAEERSQILLCGTETHVCVHQTASDLVEHAFEVHVACDAVSSQSQSDHEIALDRIAQDGASLSTSQMAVCEWLEGAHHPKFKEVIGLLKK